MLENAIVTESGLGYVDEVEGNVFGDDVLDDSSTIYNLKREVLDQLATDLAAAPGVQQVSPAITNANGTAALINVQPTGSPQDASTTQLVHHLRYDVVPAATAGSGVRARRGASSPRG